MGRYSFDAIMSLTTRCTFISTFKNELPFPKDNLFKMYMLVPFAVKYSKIIFFTILHRF